MGLVRNEEICVRSVLCTSTAGTLSMKAPLDLDAQVERPFVEQPVSALSLLTLSRKLWTWVFCNSLIMTRSPQVWNQLRSLERLRHSLAASGLCQVWYLWPSAMETCDLHRPSKHISLQDANWLGACREWMRLTWNAFCQQQHTRMVSPSRNTDYAKKSQKVGYPVTIFVECCSIIVFQCILLACAIYEWWLKHWLKIMNSIMHTMHFGQHSANGLSAYLPYPPQTSQPPGHKILKQLSQMLRLSVSEINKAEKINKSVIMIIYSSAGGKRIKHRWITQWEQQF